MNATEELLRIAEGFEGGRLELAPIRGERGGRKVRASFLLDDAPGLMGIGRTPGEAIERLRLTVAIAEKTSSTALRRT